MENRITKLFKEKTRNVLSVYFTGGTPCKNDSVDVIKALQDNGVDMVEVGIPFSDPIADGPTIQNSGLRALKNGITLKELLLQLQQGRELIKIPLIMMGYLNPIMQYGFERFCCDARMANVDGVIIPDLPFEMYMQEFRPIAMKYNIKVIMLITPETSEERIRLIDDNTDGMIYMVSADATTGARDSFDEATHNYFRRIEAMNLRNPRMIGFGISNRSTFGDACKYASGAIVGSHFIHYLLSDGCCTPDKAVKKLLHDLGCER